MLARFILRRLFLVSFVLFALSILAFSLYYLFPGDPLANLSGIRNPLDEQIPELEQRYLLHADYFSQYLAYLQRILQGDWGYSFVSQAPVLDEIFQVFPATLELAIFALTVAILVGLPLGVAAAAYPKKWLKKLIMGGTLLGYSTPIFWLALLLIMLFSLQLGWLPMSGRLSLLFEVPSVTGFMLVDILLSDIPYQWQAFNDALRHLFLPTIVLAMYPTTVLIRFTFNSLQDVLEQPYVKTARAKGLSRWQVLYRHALRNALLPVIRQVGLQFSNLLTLAMVTEVIFSWPGIGRWLIDSIYQRDYPAIQGGLLAVSCFVILATVCAELIYALANPVSRNDAHGQI